MLFRSNAVMPRAHLHVAYVLCCLNVSTVVQSGVLCLVFCDAPTPLIRQLGGALSDGPTRAGRLGQAAGETSGAGEALGGVRRSGFCFSWSLWTWWWLRGLVSSVRSVGRFLSVVAPGDHITRSSLL